MPYKFSSVPDVRVVQDTASVDVRIVPESPTAMNCDPVHAAPRKRFEVPDVCVVHVTRSDDVTIVPKSPTATN
jgi:hypothetical protein